MQSTHGVIAVGTLRKPLWVALRHSELGDAVGVSGIQIKSY